MNSKKILTLFAGIMIAMLMYVFGVMFISSKNQSGGGSASNNASGGSAQPGGSTTNNSPGNTGSSAQSGGVNQNHTANPTGGAQENFAPAAQKQPVVLPTQPVNAPRQTTGGTSNDNPAAVGQNKIQQQSQNNSVNNSQPQITQNPFGGLQ